MNNRPRGFFRLINDDDSIASDAPTDGMIYARQNGSWVLVPAAGIADAPNNGTKYVRQNLIWVPETPFPEAPNDGQYYARRSLAWQVVPPFPEAPNDGQYYARRNLSWQVTPAGIGEAPNDGQQYARQNLNWQVVTAGALALLGDVTGPANANTCFLLHNGLFNVRGNSANSNMGIGEGTLGDAIAGLRNTAFSKGGLALLGAGNDNSVFGHNAGSVLTTGSNNSIFGSQITTNATNTGTAAFGFNLKAKGNDIYFGTNIGFAAGNNANAIAIGRNIWNVNGQFIDNCIAMGTSAMANAFNPSNQIAIGNQSMQLADQAFENVGVGSFSLRELNNGQGNVAFGTECGRHTLDGNYNTAYGTLAGRGHTSGNENIEIGYQAGGTFNGKTGSRNIVIGSTSSISPVNLASNDNVIIGNNLVIPNVAFPVTMLNLNAIPIYADQAAAAAGGLVPGCLFRDLATSQLWIKN